MTLFLSNKKSWRCPILRESGGNLDSQSANRSVEHVLTYVELGLQ